MFPSKQSWVHGDSGDIYCIVNHIYIYKLRGTQRFRLPFRVITIIGDSLCNFLGSPCQSPCTTSKEDSQPDFFTRLKHRSEHWRDNLPLGSRSTGESSVHKQPTLDHWFTNKNNHQWNWPWWRNLNGLGICLIWLSQNSTKHLTPTRPTPGPRPTPVTLLCQPQQVAHVVVFSKAKAGLLSFAPRLVEVEVPRDVWGDSYRRVLVLYFLNTSLYLFINHDVLPYSTNKLFILYNTMQFCHVASPKLGGLIRQKLNDHIFLGPLAPIYIDITRSGNSWSVCDIVLCDWDNNMVRIGFGTFGGFDLAFF